MTLFPPSPADLADRDTFENEVISLHDLCRQVAIKGEPAITGKTFKNCRIDGPAVLLALEDNSFDRCHFGEAEGDPRNLMLQPMGAERVTGAAPVRKCTFVQCDFFAIGFTGSQQFLADLQRAIEQAGPVQ